MCPEVKKALDWYTHLAQQPGWKGQAWHSVNELARGHPSVFGELPRLLTEAMERIAIERKTA